MSERATTSNPEVFDFLAKIKNHKELYAVFTSVFTKQPNFSLDLTEFLRDSVVTERVGAMKMPQSKSTPNTTWLVYCSIRVRGTSGKLQEKRLPIATVFSPWDFELDECSVNVHQFFPVLNQLFLSSYGKDFNPITERRLEQFYSVELKQLKAEQSKYLPVLKRYLKLMATVYADYFDRQARVSHLAKQKQNPIKRVDVASAIIDDLGMESGLYGAFHRYFHRTTEAMPDEAFAQYLTLVKTITMMLSQTQQDANFFSRNFFSQNLHNINLSKITEGLALACVAEGLDGNDPASIIELTTRAIADANRYVIQEFIGSKPTLEELHALNLVDGITSQHEMSADGQQLLADLQRKGNSGTGLEIELINDDEDEVIFHDEAFNRLDENATNG